MQANQSVTSMFFSEESNKVEPSEIVNGITTAGPIISSIMKSGSNSIVEDFEFVLDKVKGITDEVFSIVTLEAEADRASIRKVIIYFVSKAIEEDRVDTLDDEDTAHIICAILKDAYISSEVKSEPNEIQLRDFIANCEIHSFAFNRLIQQIPSAHANSLIRKHSNTIKAIIKDALSDVLAPDDDKYHEYITSLYKTLGICFFEMYFKEISSLNALKVSGLDVDEDIDGKVTFSFTALVSILVGKIK